MEIVNSVTPHVGVWIETFTPFDNLRPVAVTPHVGVWIETVKERTELKLL